ncbi:hypothetical protein POTOM_048202 [Populus tomentosa]|uniref:Uncharacterized protein n=1 Tax=Populus tomentosa TaxID=118781 RepID=A0A8X7YNM4_POPTO|nr:hypothetical protein POTOM_048202 [Populus tomentosa]
MIHGKEVSEEGRLAFQALFAREVLPQSFSPLHDLKSKMHQNEDTGEKKDAEEKDGDASLINLNSKTRECLALVIKKGRRMLCLDVKTMGRRGC